MKFILSIFVGVFISLNILASNPVKITEFSNSEWVNIYSESGVEISYKVMKCAVGCNHTMQEYVVVKINNTNNQEIKLDFDISIKYENNGNVIAKSNHKIIELQHNQIIEGVCNNTQAQNKLKISKIYKKNDSGAILSEVSLNNITVE